MTLTLSSLSKNPTHRTHLGAACLCALILGMCYSPIAQFLSFTAKSVESSDLWLIPLISIFLLFSGSISYFAPELLRRSWWALLITAVGVLIANKSHAGIEGIPTVPVLGLLLALIGCFFTCYGARVAWRARFPLLFSLLAIPIPGTMLDTIVSWLQHGSAAVVQALLWLLRVDFVRDGVKFQFPSFAIEIASECSGIRSSFALLVLTLLMAETTLNTRWRRFLLIVAVFPLVLIKNGIRIVTLTMLAMKVDPAFLSGSLHHHGGFVFFGIALGLEALLWGALARSERALSNPVLHPSTKVRDFVAVSPKS